jgi:hypothetical protein
MKPYTEHRMYTATEQLVIIQPNETHDGLILRFGETTEKGLFPRLYLTHEEAIELSNMLKTMLDKIKNNSI